MLLFYWLHLFECSVQFMNWDKYDITWLCYVIIENVMSVFIVKES